MDIDQIINKIEQLERLPLALVTMAGPWLTPIIPAWFIAVAIRRYLNAPLSIAVTAGFVIEVVGIAGIANATNAYLYNRTRRKTDPEAPLALSIAAVAVYFLTALLLTVIIEIWGQFVTIAPAAFIILSISSGLILTLSNLHRLRLREIEAERREKRATRAGIGRESGGNQSGTDRESTGNRPGADRELSAGTPATNRESTGNLNIRINPSTITRARQILAQHPAITGAELGRQLGKSESLGRKIRAELIAGNGQGGPADL